jgi:hypothetical protein
MIAVPVEGYNFAPSTTSSTTSAIAQNTGTGTGSGPTTSSTNPSSSGLSSGAKAGIAGGVAGLVVVLVALGAFWFFRRRKNHAAPASELPANGYGPNAATGGEYRGAFEPVKNGALVEAESKPMTQRFEIDTSRYKPVELAG